jgi:hypothetical protein
MSLPQINAPEYKLRVPSTDEEITYRPFLVKEEKLLLIAQETGTDKSTYDAIKQIIKSCCSADLNVEKMPLFDMEYIFLNIRARSVGEVTKIKIKCPDDEKTEVEVEIDLTEVQVQMDENHDARIQLTEDVGILMSYPSIGSVGYTTNQKGDKGQAKALFEMISNCMYQIWEGEETHDCMDYSPKDKLAFLESLSHKQFESVQKFFETMPTLKKDIEVTNPNTQVKSTVTLQGMNDFF